jgi:hypothetical protein
VARLVPEVGGDVFDPTRTSTSGACCSREAGCSGQPLFKELKSLDFLIERGHDASFAAKPVQTLQK